MAKATPNPDEDYGESSTAERTQTPESHIAEGVPELDTVQPLAPAVPKELLRENYANWVRNRIAALYGRVASSLLASCFGASTSRRGYHGRLWTDRLHADYVTFGSYDRLDDSVVCKIPAPTVTQMLWQQRKPAERVGLLIHYREADTPVVGLNGEKLAVESRSVKQFTRERAIRSKALVEAGERLSDCPPLEFFELGEIPPQLRGDEFDVFVNAPPELLSRAGLAGGTTLHGYKGTAGVPFSDILLVGKFLVEHAKRTGGELISLLRLLPEKWEALRLEKRLDDAARLAIREATAEELATELPLSRLGSIAEQRLTAELGVMDATLPRSLDARLTRVETGLAELQEPIRRLLLTFIEDINALDQERRTMGSLEGNKRFVSTLQRMLTAVGERLCCPSCESPGTFRCKAGNSPDGVFEFTHSVGESKLGKRGCGGWSRIPSLSLIDKP